MDKMPNNYDMATLQELGGFSKAFMDTSKEHLAQSGQMSSMYIEMMKRMLDKEDETATGNPFIDMLNGYVKMKKRSNPNYQWEGFAPKIARGVGGLLGMNTGGRLGLSDGSVRPSFLTAQPQISESSPGALDQYRQTQSMRPIPYEED